MEVLHFLKEHYRAKRNKRIRKQLEKRIGTNTMTRHTYGLDDYELKPHPDPDGLLEELKRVISIYKANPKGPVITIDSANMEGHSDGQKTSKETEDGIS